MREKQIDRLEHIIERSRMRDEFGYKEFFFENLDVYFARKKSGTRTHLSKKEMRSWMILATLGQKTYNMLSDALNGPCLSTVQTHLYDFKREIGLDAKFVSEKYTHNPEYINRYRYLLGLGDDEELKGSICVDAVSCTVKGYYTVDKDLKKEYHNCIQIPIGPNKG